jgi:hypothetical protein
MSPLPILNLPTRAQVIVVATLPAVLSSTSDALLVGDLHLTTQPRDAYRWLVFDQIKQALLKHQPKHLVLLGDLTDEKDRHAAELVNKICDNLVALGQNSNRYIHIVRGNHDGIDPEWPYFRFLGNLPGVQFYAQPAEMFGNRDAFVLPHSRDPLVDWKAIDFSCYKTVFAHVTVKGAEAESGVALRSVIGADYFRKRDVIVYSGDVHVPQKIGPVVYVGAPYPIRFGDKFKPRLVYLGKAKALSIEVPTIARMMLDLKDASELSPSRRPNLVKVNSGDQAKVRLHLPEDRLGDWLAQRRAIIAHCRKLGLDLVSVEVVREEGARPMLAARYATLKEPQAVLAKYVQQQHVRYHHAHVGKDLLARVLNEPLATPR